MILKYVIIKNYQKGSFNAESSIRRAGPNFTPETRRMLTLIMRTSYGESLVLAEVRQMKPFHIRSMINNKLPWVAMRAPPSKWEILQEVTSALEPTKYTLQKVSSHNIAQTMHFPFEAQR